MQIGIVSKSSKEFFNNGCNQQGIFVYEAINNIPHYDCYIIIASDETYLNLKTINCAKNFDKLKTLDIILFVSGHIHDENLLKHLALNGVTMITYNCGNYYYIYQEDIIFNTHSLIKRDTNTNYSYRYFSEYWCIPNYAKDKYFYETMYDLKFKTAPYVWNDTIIKDYKGILYDPLTASSNTKTILILEPNIQITKTCLMPLLLCERLYKSGYTNIKVLVLCKPDTDAFKIFIGSLQMYKKGLVELYPRLKYFDIIKQLKDKSEDFYIVSHHRDNALNFLHLETLYLGYPLIHNCDYYKKAGYYYNNIKEGANQLLHSINTHKNNIKTYNEEAKKTLYTFSPNNPININMHKHLLDNINAHVSE